MSNSSETSDAERNEEMRSTDLMDLPDEMLLHIMNYLPLYCIKNVRLTCSRLHRISYAREIVKKHEFVVIDRQNIKPLHEMLDRMNVSYVNLQFLLPLPMYEIIIQDWTIFKTFIRLNSSKIQSIIIHFYEMAQQLMECIMLSCYSLKKLSLSFGSISWSKKTKITSCAKNTTLQTLEICSSVCNVDLYQLIKSCLKYYFKIESLKISISNGRPENCELIRKLIMTKIATNNTSVQKLYLNLPGTSCGQSLMESDLKLQIFKELEFNCDKLFMLNNFENFIEQYSQLESLSLIFGRFDICIFEILQKIHRCMKKLKTLKFINLTPPQDFNNYNSNIRQLRLIYLQHFELNSLKNFLSLDLRFLQNCHLKVLKLHMKYISIETIFPVISSLKNSLVTLDLSFSIEYFDSRNDIFKFLSNLHLPKLEELVLSVNISVMNYVKKTSFLCEIVNAINFPQMKKMELSSPLYLIGERELEEIRTGCPCLEFLRVRSPLSESLIYETLRKSIFSLKLVQVLDIF